MKKTIYRNMLGLTIVSVALNSILLLIAVYTSIDDQKIYINSILQVIIVIIFSFFACELIASELSKRIIKPIKNMNEYEIQDNIYEEFLPFIKKINTQKAFIESQVNALEERKTTIRIITENMREGILILDKEGTILLLNNSALNFFYSDKNDYSGKNILEFTRNLEFINGIKKSQSGENCEVIININNKTIQAFLSPVINFQKVNGVIVLFLDVTSKISAEKMRREFSANVSHELKTPLTTIAGFSEMIYNDMVKIDDVKVFAGKIKEESNRLIALIEDIIRISQLDESNSTKHFTEFNLKVVVFDVVKHLKAFAETRNVCISINSDDNTIFANNQMIYEILYNLVENSIKYNKENGSVTITTSNENDKTKIEVSDTGIGIGKAHLERVFERFYRVDSSRSKKTGGTGLGLSIVKHMVEYHGGTVAIESEEGVGTKITIILRQN